MSKIVQSVQLTVNGKAYQRTVEPRMLLSDFLRQELDLAGTHVGCEHGSCGACTILLDGVPTRSCLVLAVQANGREIGTIEGLGALIMEARTFYRSDVTIVGMLIIGVIGFLISSGLGRVEKILVPWDTGLDEVRR